MAEGLHLERSARRGHLQARQGDHRHQVAEPDPLHHHPSLAQLDAAARQDAGRGAQALGMDGDLGRGRAGVPGRGRVQRPGGVEERGAGPRGRERPSAQEQLFDGALPERLRGVGQDGHLPEGGLHRRL
jgi:hypothetical protein